MMSEPTDAIFSQGGWEPPCSRSRVGRAADRLLPLSAEKHAGKGAGEADARHLGPAAPPHRRVPTCNALVSRLPKP